MNYLIIIVRHVLPLDHLYSLYSNYYCLEKYSSLKIVLFLLHEELAILLFIKCIDYENLKQTASNLVLQGMSIC